MPFSKLQISTFLQTEFLLFFFKYTLVYRRTLLIIGILILASYTFKKQMTDFQTPPSENGGTISQDKTNIKKTLHRLENYRIILVLPQI